MMAERLAQMRAEYDSIEGKPNHTVGHIRELLDHIAQLEAHKAESMQVFAALQIQEIAKEIGAPLGSGVPEQILPWIKSAKVQLEAQRGELARELDLTKREAWTAKERHKDEKDRADGLRERLDELNAEDFARAQRGEFSHVEASARYKELGLPDDVQMHAIFLEGWNGGVQQRGGAVVVPEPTVKQWIKEVLDAAYNDPEPHATMRAAAKWFRENAKAIPADRVLGDGMVGVDREELMYLHAFEKYARKHGPESIQDVAGTLDHLRSAQQAKGE